MEKIGRLMFMTTLFFLSASAQPGFLNLNCGGTKNYSDSQTNMTWIMDDNFIDVGKIAANIGNSSIPDYLRSLRYFPKPQMKSCYELPVAPDVPYLLRLRFHFGNYNGIQNPPRFNVSLEAQGNLSQQIDSFAVAGTDLTSEKILTSSNDRLYVCFIRTEDASDPFISAIELSRLSIGMYGTQVKPGTMLSSVSSYDLGANSTQIRYPQDPFDRFWQFDSSAGLYNKSLVQIVQSDKNISSDNSTSNFPPNIVMQTAIVAKTNVSQLKLRLGEQPKTKTIVALYFAEVETLNTSESRNFNVTVNGLAVATINFSEESSTIEKRVKLNKSQGGELVISLDAIKQQGNSSRGPLINAMEQYDIIDAQQGTSSQDVSALLHIKSSFGNLLKNWTADPCFGFPWDGVRCNKSNPIRVSELDLSGRGLAGQLTNLCNLTNVEKLNFRNNKLSGAIPDCLSGLPNLNELHLDHNNFSGFVPQGLLNKRNLKLSFSDNPFLKCTNSSRCHPKDKKVGIMVGSTVAAVLAFIFVFILIIIYRRKYSKRRTALRTKAQKSLLVRVPNPQRPCSFSLAEMKTATQNFSQQIGQGGFGSVYFGTLQDGQEVAVKVLSASSKQGIAEFLNEIDLLSKVNHKNLVSLLGYCNVSKELMLVYEYMGGGTLRDHLYGSLASDFNLDWKSRLRVALDAAEGLEYLHVSSAPKIIHRDVKSSNILLDSNMRAKVADFGLSKIIGDDAISHVTTTVKGTMGYLDPEYFGTNKLTERSDVYSFGIVLLEMISGRKPIEEALSEEELNIVKWVLLHAEANEDSSRQLTDIIDDKLSMASEDEMESFYLLIDLSIRCVHSDGSKRPTMSEIVRGIKEAMIVIKPKEDDESPAKPLCSAEYSTSLLHVGR